MMKKILLLLFAGCLSLGVMADDDDETRIKGSKIAKITYSGDSVTIHYNDGIPDYTFLMEEITLDFSAAATIEKRMAIAKKWGVEGKKVYNLQGELVGESAARMGDGTYIIEGRKVIIKTKNQN